MWENLKTLTKDDIKKAASVYFNKSVNDITNKDINIYEASLLADGISAFNFMCDNYLKREDNILNNNKGTSNNMENMFLGITDKELSFINVDSL